jgi:hypothetical protein
MKTTLPWIQRLLCSALIGWIGGMAHLACGQPSSTNIITGSISVPGEQDPFSFQVADRALFCFDSLTNQSSLRWDLTGPTGLLVNNRPLSSSDAGSIGDPVLRLLPGNYTLTLYGNADATGGYSFRLVNLAAATLITPGTVISNTFSPPNVTHFYQFPAAAGDQFEFDRLTLATGIYAPYWRLIDPFGQTLFENSFNDVGTNRLRAAGTYTLLVEGYIGNAVSGSYSFNVVPRGNVTPVPFSGTPIAIGQIVSDSLTNQTTNAFTFSLAGRQRLILDTQTNSPSLYWSLEGPPGLVVSDQALNWSDWASGSSPLDLPAGDYQLRVRRTTTGTSAYRFRLLDPAGATPITPGTPVTASLAPTTEMDLYRFEATAGSRFYFDFNSTNGPPSAYWRLIDPLGSVVATAYVTQDRGPTTLTLSGTHTLAVDGYFGDDPGNTVYRFTVVPVNDGVQALSLGTLTSGAISAPGEAQRYLFTLGSAATLYFDSRTNNNQLRWSLEGLAGVLVNNRAFTASDGPNIGNPLLPLAAGDYTLAVTGNGDQTGGFAFRLFDLGTAPPLTPGMAVTGTLSPANETDAYRFTAAPGTELYFDSISSSGLPDGYYRCVDRFGAVVFANYINSDSGPVTLTAGGLYTLLVEGYHSDPGSGAYTVNVVPVIDGAQSLTMGDLISGAVASPGQAQVYTFTLPSAAMLYFDSRTNLSSLRWSLRGPTGNLVNNLSFTQTDANNANAVLNLPAGGYTLTVNASSDNTGGFQFRLIDLATAPPLTLGVPVSGTLNPANETDAYRFTAAAGAKVYFDFLNSTNLPDAYWRCVDSSGASVFGTWLGNVGPVVLPAGGLYTLLVEGYHSDPGSGTYTVNVVPVDDGVQSLALGSVVRGAIATPGQVQRHTFTLAAPATCCFDSLTNNSSLRWTLDGPTGRLVNNRSFTGSDAQSVSDPLLPLTPGDYTLTVANANTDSTGGYHFRLFDIATATPFTPGSVVSGSLTPGNETDAYRFTAEAGDRFFFDWVSQTGIPNVYWRLFDPYGSRIFGNSGSDFGTNRLVAAGIYTLLIEGFHSDLASGFYQFNVVPAGNVPPTFPGTPLTIGATVTGTLATATTTNDFNFTLAAPTRLFFDTLVNAGFVWSLIGPPGDMVVNRAFWSSDSVDIGDASVVCPAGMYRLTVSGLAGAYSFRLLDAAAAAPFTPGTLFSGSVSPGRGTALYRFSANAGDRFYCDGRPASGFSGTAYFRICGPFGLVQSAQAVSSDVDVFAVPHTGDYIVSVEGRCNDTALTGNFTFLLQPVLDGTNTFTVGETVAGAIAVPGQRQFHFFSLPSPARLFFDSLSNIGLTWTLTGPPGVIINNRALYSSDSADGEASLNLSAGDYLILVDGNGAETNAYAFRLVDSSSAIAFVPGSLVNRSLAPGASTVLYRFNAAAGDRFYFDGRPASGFSYTPYTKLYSPLGNILFSQPVTSDEDSFVVPQSGSYLLSVEGRCLDTGTNGNFSFLLQPVVDGTNSFTVGATVNSAIAVAGQRQFHRFSLAAPARLFFDNLSNVGFGWTLTGPSGVIVNNRALFSSDSADGDSLLDLPMGDYLIAVDSTGTNTGSYAFRLLDAAAATPFTPDTLVSGSLAPGNSTAIYRFTANAGDQFYFDGRPTSGFIATPYVRVYTPLLGLLFSRQVTSDEDTFVVPQSGDYLLPVEGRYYDTSTNGTFSFLLARNPPQPPSPLFETNAAPDLVVTVVSLNPPSGLQSGQSATVQWTVRNNGTAPTPGAFTDRISVRNNGTSQILVNRALPYDPATGGFIAPSETRVRQLVITLPDGTASVGTLEVTVTTDTLNNVFEQNAGGTAEANNATSITTTTTLAPYPDLEVASLAVSPPSGWLTNSTVTLSWVITNTGTRATAGSWTESLVVRNTNTAQVIVNSTTSYDESEPGNGPIAPADSRNRSLTFTLPNNANAYGAFEVVVTTDSDNLVFEYNAGGSAETNNSRSLLSASAPDLQITGLTVTGNPNLQAGAQLTIQWNTVNQGNVQADGSFYDRIVVRNTNTAEVLLNTTLPYNPSLVGNGPILPGGSRARQQVYQLPDGSRSVGRIEVTVTVDTFNQLAEYNAGGTGEANNSTQTQVTVAGRPYPDLVVTNVSGPATGRPGRSVPVVWTVRNVGTVSATNPWTDHLFLSLDPAVGGDQYLTSVSAGGPLGPGESLTRTQQVILPTFGTGNRYFVVETDAGSQVFEENETNNTAVADVATVVPATLTLTLSPATVSESAGSQASLATLVRNSDVASALLVTLGNSQPAKVIAPANITLPIGARSTNFFLQVVDDTIAWTNITAVITASAAAHVAATNTLTVIENDSPALTLRLSAPSVAENAGPGVVTATVTRNAQTNLALTVNLTSDRSGVLEVPPSVTIAAGQTNVTFSLVPVNDELVTGNRIVSILAAAPGYTSVSAHISVLDDDTVALALQLSDSTVSETAINPAALGVVTRTPVSTASMRVRLRAVNGSLVQLPAEVTIPASQPAVTFNVNVRDDTLAFGAESATLVAEALAVDGSMIPGASASAPFTVLDNDGPTLSVSISAAVIAEGTSTTGTVTRNTPPTNSLAVTLSAAPAGQATAPGSVVIPLGAASTNFTINGVADGVSDGAQEVTVTATAAGFNPGTAPLTVTDIDVPDLAVIEVSAPTNALTDGLISVVWSVTNSGLATATGTWVDEVYLATDAQGANASPLAIVTNQGPLVVGESYSLSRSFLLPSDPGTYWVLIRTDAGGAIAEGSERNNVALSAALDVQPSYRATVSTPVDSAISGTPIPLTGQVFFSTNGAPAPFRTATVRINVNRVRRILQVVSDAQGNFSTAFQPIPGEAGVYTVGADHPRVKVDPVQDQFVLLGMSAVPWELSLRLAPNVTFTGQIEVRNLSPLPLTGLLVDSEGLPLDFNLTATITNTLAGSQTAVLDFNLVTTLSSAVSGRLAIRVTSAEGAVLRIPVNFVVAPPTAQLLAEPTFLERGMLRGTQTLVQFDVVNQGGVASGDLAVALPVLPWLSLISTSPVPSLAPGARSTVVLALNPATNLPLTRYDGNLVLIGPQTSLSVPFQFRALSDARGDLVLTATDENTYFVNGAPKVTNATMVLRDPITNGDVAQAVTDTNGQVRFDNLAEGDYLLEASAPNHSGVRGGVRVVPGLTSEQEVFMSQQSVRYEWRVVPTEIEDHYRVVLEPLFETEVPAPNLVVENPVLIPLVIPGLTSQVEIHLRNTGLIALQHVRIPVPSHPKLIITPLVTELEELPALTSISVPVTIRLAEGQGGGAAGFRAASAPGGGGSGACEGTECVVHMPIDTSYKCGQNFVTKEVDVQLQVVCVPDTGCNFDFTDVTRVDFGLATQAAYDARFQCLLGNMNECQKARVRGYLKSGDLGSVDGPFGFGISDFCACGPPEKIPALFAAAEDYMATLGFTSSTPIPGGVSYGPVTLLSEVPCNRSFAAAPGVAPAVTDARITSPSPASPATGVCARVRLELSQDITLTRSAFRGTLLLDNEDVTDLTGITLTIDFRNAANESSAALFDVRGPTLSGLTGVDGSGVLAAGASGSAEYIFVPTLDAAPSSPTAYYIGGTLRYLQNGQEVTITLLPGAITVLPEARLSLEYFQQRDVYSDDPFTPELEPAEPFALGLRVLNSGAGTARYFRIASAQPRIIENEKGLLIDFQLIGARVGNQPVTPSFNLDLGNIDPGQSKIVVWDMTSTLQGKFIDYRASFEHVDDLGMKNLSLIEGVNIHELIHVVRADRPADDTLPDFLVNDTPDPNNLPDIVYLSEGSNAPVSLGSNAVVDSPAATNHLAVQLTVTMPAGWSYLRTTNPGPDFRLVSVRRSDGKMLRLGENAWTTDRTFPASQTSVVREKLLHLFDDDSTGSYTLTFAPVMQDTNPPVSAVAALPATSPASFAVEWSGDDGSNGTGIAFFDLFVSVNGGAFSNWLEHTTLQSAIFNGVNGNTYAFYSRATDLAGNQELAPTSGDAQTAASGANTAPSLMPAGDVTVNEGDLFSLQPTAIDTDSPRQTLSFSLLTAPAGATIDAAGGFIRWQTGEAQGGTTNLFTVVVTDNGLPSLGATQSFYVIVREVNSPPLFVDLVSDVAVDEETTLNYTVAASDADLPLNTLTWQLGAGAPPGMTINTFTGALVWTPNEADGPGEFPVSITVRDNGVPVRSTTRTLRIIVREVNRPPVLAPIPTQATLVQTTLYVTNSAADPDLPAQSFFYSLAPGAPRGAWVNRVTGVFSWTPSPAYAQSTNFVTVRATDNGVPSLTAEQTFAVIVGDYLEARLGTGIVLAGQTGGVPVVVFTTVPVTNLNFVFTVSPDRLTDFALAPPTAPLGSAVLQPLADNRFQVRMGTLAGLSLAGEQTVSELRFTALPGQPSAFVPLEVSDVSGTQNNGQPVPRAAGSDGRVVYLGAEPLLELLRREPQFLLVLYGRPAASCTVESTFSLTPAVTWTPFWVGPWSNLVEVFPLTPTNQARFFRAVWP